MTVYGIPALDCSIGISMLLSWAVSLLLNPISFYYHHKKTTVAARLFTLLAVFDFLCNLYQPLVLGYNFLKSSEDEEKEALPISFVASSEVFNLLGFYTAFIVNTIAVTRLVSVRFPHHHIRKIFIWVFLAAVLVWLAVNSTVAVVTSSRTWDPKLQSVNKTSADTFLNWSYLAAGLAYNLMFLIGIPCSLLTVFTICRADMPNPDPERVQRRRNASMTIISLCLANSLLVLAFPLGLFLRGNEWGDFFAMFAMSIGAIHLSAIDPVVIILLSSEIRAMLSGWVNVIRQNLWMWLGTIGNRTITGRQFTWLRYQYPFKLTQVHNSRRFCSVLFEGSTASTNFTMGIMHILKL